MGALCPLCGYGIGEFIPKQNWDGEPYKIHAHHFITDDLVFERAEMECVWTPSRVTSEFKIDYEQISQLTATEYYSYLSDVRAFECSSGILWIADNDKIWDLLDRNSLKIHAEEPSDVGM